MVRLMGLDHLGVMNSQNCIPSSLPGQTHIERRDVILLCILFYNNFVWDFTSVIFCCSFLNEISFPELVERGTVQQSFFNISQVISFVSVWSSKSSLVSYGSGGWKFKIKVLAELGYEGCAGRICSRPLSLAYRWPSSTSSFSNHLLSMCVSVSVSIFPLFIKIPIVLD